MALVKVRRFVVAVPPEGVPIESGDVTLVEEVPQFELNLAEMLRMNARAVSYQGSLLPQLVQREMALVLSVFDRTAPGVPLGRHAAFEGSSSHIRRFVSEVVALGALTAVVLEGHPRLTDVAHFDALRPELRQAYPSGRLRPDLRFAGGQTVLAGESRGRATEPPQRTPTSATQRKRLDELLTWSRQPDCDEVCMAWSWMRRHQTQVDFFRFDRDTTSPEVTEHVKRHLERGLEHDRLRARHRNESPHSVPTVPIVTRADERTVKERFIRRSIEELEEELVENMPAVPVAGLAGPWAGRWQDVLGLNGQVQARLLLAVNREGRSAKVDSARWNTVEQSRGSQIEVSAEGRLLVAIDWALRPEPEAGRTVETVLSSSGLA